MPERKRDSGSFPPSAWSSASNAASSAASDSPGASSVAGDCSLVCCVLPLAGADDIGESAPPPTYASSASVSSPPASQSPAKRSSYVSAFALRAGRPPNCGGAGSVLSRGGGAPAKEGIVASPGASLPPVQKKPMSRPGGAPLRCSGGNASSCVRHDSNDGINNGKLRLCVAIERTSIQCRTKSGGTCDVPQTSCCTVAGPAAEAPTRPR